MKTTLRVLLVVLVALSGCRALDVPSPPGEGSIQGTVYFTRPGSTAQEPAGGATIELLGSSLSTKADPQTGYFSLSPIPVSAGALLFRYDADGDGTPEHLKVLRLESLKAGPGKTVALGDVVLAGSASLSGSVLRADALASASGHGGTSAFMPEGPYLAYSGDNGDFSMENLPEGEVSVAFFRTGYRSQQMTVTLRAGERFSLPTVILAPESGTVAPVEVHGLAALLGATSFEGIEVTTNTGERTTTGADGTYAFPALPAGVYTFGFVKEGYQTLSLRNIPVSGQSFQVRTVVLVPGASTPPDLDAGQGYDAGAPPDAGSGDDAGTDAGFDAGFDAGTDAGFDAGTDAGFDAGTDAGFDAGVDAGFDAGVDAGFDAGVDAGFDAGVDAGFDAGVDAGFDAGVDAGFDAGVDAGFDAGVDAGFDAGIAPVAVISTPPVFVSPNQFFTLSGTNSQGTPPFAYLWTQTRGTAVTVNNNGTTMAASPSIRAPATAGVLGFTLTVTDAFNNVSAPSAEVLVPVGNRPTAVISSGYPTTVYANQVVAFDGSTSSDGLGTGISSYVWSVSPAGFAQTTQNGGSRLLVTMPSSVTTSQVVTVTLTVINGVSIASNPVSVNITLSNLAPPAWGVDAGPGQTVGAGDVVTIRGLATAPGNPTATFTYEWTPASESLDGGAPDWLLTDPTANVTTFVAPSVVGPNRLINLTLTATSTSGLTPPTAVGTTFVNVQDRQPPTVVGTSIDATFHAGTMGLTVDFSEPVDPATLGSVQVTGGTVANRTLLTPTRLLLVFGPMLLDGNSYTLNVSGVRDLSPQANAITPVSYPFVAQKLFTPAFESTQTFTTNPRPGHVIRRPGGGKTYEVLAFGRNDTSAVFLDAFNPYGCPTAPCAMTTDTTAPTAALNASPPTGPLGLEWGGAAVASLETPNYVSMVQPRAYTRPGAAWSSLPTPPGWLYSDGMKLYSAYVESGVKVATWNPMTSTWSTATPEVVSTDGVLFSNDATSSPIVVGNAQLGYDTFLFAKTSKTGAVHAWSRSTAGTWTDYGDFGTGSLSDKVTDVRITGIWQYANAAFAGYLQQSGKIQIVLFGSVNNGSTPWPSGATAFDMGLRPNGTLIAATANGKLTVRIVNSGTGAATVAVPGPHPGDLFNNDPACTADSPEMTVIDEKIALSWAEHCSTGPWHIYFRLLN